MKVTELNMIVEPSYSLTHWYKNTLEGINNEINRKGLILNIYILNSENSSDIFMKCKKSERVVLVLGASAAWEEEIVRCLCALNIHPLLVSSQFTDTQYPYSYVTLNHLEATSHITRYLINSGCKRIAFFGMNPDALPDMLKYKGFCKVISEAGLETSEKDIYINKGCISDCVLDLCNNLYSYDGILCVNDIVAIILMQAIKYDHKKNLKDYYITGFGDTLAGKFISPSLTTVTLDYYEAGRKAVELYLYIAKNPVIVSSSITVASHIKIRESTQNREIEFVRYAPHSYSNTETVNFYNDIKVKEVFNLENLLTQLDDLDENILKQLISGFSYENIAEKLNMSVTAIKYRTKKMLANSELKTKSELVLLMLKYSTNKW